MNCLRRGAPLTRPATCRRTSLSSSLHSRNGRRAARRARPPAARGAARSAPRCSRKLSRPRRPCRRGRTVRRAAAAMTFSVSDGRGEGWGGDARLRAINHEEDTLCAKNLVNFFSCFFFFSFFLVFFFFFFFFSLCATMAEALALDWGEKGGKCWEFWKCDPQCEDPARCIGCWCCCGPCSAGKLMATAANQEAMGWVNNCLAMCCCGPCMMTITRHNLRVTNGIAPSPDDAKGWVGDCLCSFCCGVRGPRGGGGSVFFLFVVFLFFVFSLFLLYWFFAFLVFSLRILVLGCRLLAARFPRKLGMYIGLAVYLMCHYFLVADWFSVFDFFKTTF
jgi:hypothetical protein